MTDTYYEDEFVTLYCGDCLDHPEWWTAADVLITDPPYGIGGSLNFHKAGRVVPTFAQQAWGATLEVRGRALDLWGGRPAPIFRSPPRLDGAPPHREVPLIWDKGNIVAMGDISFPWRPNYELIYISGPGWHGHRDTAVVHCEHHTNAARDIGHPTPKPIQLMEHLVRKSPEGVIADPFTGSGSTLIAAKMAGRRAIGVEMNEEYCEIAANRLAQDALDFEG